MIENQFCRALLSFGDWIKLSFHDGSLVKIIRMVRKLIIVMCFFLSRNDDFHWHFRPLRYICIFEILIDSVHFNYPNGLPPLYIFIEISKLTFPWTKKMHKIYFSLQNILHRTADCRKQCDRFKIMNLYLWTGFTNEIFDETVISTAETFFYCLQNAT